MSLLALTAGAGAQDTLAHRRVIVASKPFGESYILAEMFSQLLESRGMAVERRQGLGATEIAFNALREGAIDVYPEYTGTGLLVILHEQPTADPAAVFARVATESERRFGVRWLPPLGFENTYTIAVRRETADRLGLRTLSDLGQRGSALVAGFTPDFIGRVDGLPGLTRVYAFRPRQVRALLPAVKYQALAASQVDVIDGYSTDGFITRYHLVTLEDDKHFFPPYEAAAVVGARLARENPRAIAALTELSGRVSELQMRELNRRVEVDGEDVPRVAASALRALALVSDSNSATTAAVRSERESLIRYLWERRTHIGSLTLRHLLLVGVSLALAIIFAVPLGVALERWPRLAEDVVRGTGVLQTIPSIALLAFMIPLLGIGIVPALAGLFLYSLFPIVRTTYTGVRDADPEATDAARALGMTDGQVLRQVRFPLAMPAIMAGVRTAAVIDVGTATMAAFIGAGGLGDPIVSGLALSDTRMILSGAIPAALLALVVDGLLAGAERVATPKALRERRERN